MASLKRRNRFGPHHSGATKNAHIPASINGCHGRTPDGKFAVGGPPGPGRPPRPTERAYLIALSDAVSVDDWKQVVRKALADAQSGDAVARQWLAHYLLGASPMTLSAAAVHEVADPTGVMTLTEAVARELIRVHCAPACRIMDEAAEDLVEAHLSGRSIVDIVRERLAADGDDPAPGPEDDDDADDDLYTPQAQPDRNGKDQR